MIEKVVETWHRFLAGQLPDALEGLLADDVVFYSPIVYTPQRGKDVTTMYLRAAAQTLPGGRDARIDAVLALGQPRAARNRGLVRGVLPR
jgi:hypothetical protein